MSHETDIVLDGCVTPALTGPWLRVAIEGLRRMDVRRGPMHNDQGPRVRGYKIMTTPNEALRTILPIAGWGDRQAVDVMFTGGADPVLPTPFRIGAAGAATLAATGLAATELWQVRTGRRQRVTVDLRQATAALRSGHYIQLGDTGVSSARNTVMGFYLTRDGRWSYLHSNFPNHRAAALSVLGVPEDREAVARAVAIWNAADLEEAIIAAKGAGGMARTQAEWARHPHLRVDADLHGGGTGCEVVSSARHA